MTDVKKQYVGFTDLIEQIRRDSRETRLYDALKRIDTTFAKVFGILQDHEDRIATIEESKKRARVFRTTDQTITTATVTPIQFDTTIFNNDNMTELAVNNTRITFNTPGYYYVGGNVRWASAAAGVRQGIIMLSGGATQVASERVIVDTTALNVTINLGAVWKFVQGDYIELNVFQTSGGNLNVQTVNYDSPAMWAVMVERSFNPGDIPGRIE